MSDKTLPPSDADILACNGNPDEPTISAPDADLIVFGRAVLALVDDPHKAERKAHFALMDRMHFPSCNPRVRALQDAIEGECDGLGISNETAEAILRYVDERSSHPAVGSLSEADSGGDPWGEAAPVAFRLSAPSGTSAVLTEDGGLAGDMLNRGWTVQPLVPADFPQVQNDEVVTPVMDGYRMKCCGCGLVHKMTFRAIKVKEHSADGTFTYEELAPSEYRISLSARRECEQCDGTGRYGDGNHDGSGRWIDCPFCGNDAETDAEVK